MIPLIDSLASLLATRTGAPVERHETHISWILLSGDEAWKLKKPVHLPFVDFRNADTRRRVCEAEVRLNRRLAPSLYLGILAVSGTAADPRVGDDHDGPVIDWLVRMRRFPVGALFAERLAAGALGTREIEALALRLARFHEEAPVQTDPALADAVVTEAMSVLAQLRDRFATPSGDPIPPASPACPPACPPASLPAGPPADLAPRIAALSRWLDVAGRRLAPVLAARLRHGRVRDVHGDLHLANAVVLGDEVTAFDCLEFNDRMRRIDVIGDPAFLAMDLDAHGRPDLANRLIDAWCEASDDRAAVAVLPLHRIYRAAVRALVACLSPGPDGLVAARRYLDTAERTMTAATRRPRLLITHGLSGSGKSFAALRVVEQEGALRLRADVERKRLAGLDALSDSARAGLAIYTPDWSARTYARLESLAITVLDAGRSPVVDAAFLGRAQRQRFAALARAHGVDFAILDCRAELATLRQRIVSRAAAGGDPSEATTAVLERQLASLEPLDVDERRVAIDCG